jgi:hypothetical protein
MSGGHLNAANLDGTAFLDRLPVLYPLALQIREDLEVGHHYRAGLLRDRNSVGEVVEVAVGDEHRIELADLFHVLRCLGVVR